MRRSWHRSAFQWMQWARVAAVGYDQTGGRRCIGAQYDLGERDHDGPGSGSISRRRRWFSGGGARGIPRLNLPWA